MLMRPPFKAHAGFPHANIQHRARGGNLTGECWKSENLGIKFDDATGKRSTWTE
jgi:hypothetical protein